MNWVCESCNEIIGIDDLQTWEGYDEKEFYHSRCYMVIEGDLVECRRCGRDEWMDELPPERKKRMGALYGLWDAIFFKRPRPYTGTGDFPAYCFDCCEALNDWMPIMRDIDETRYFVNKLQRAISDVKNNRN